MIESHIMIWFEEQRFDLENVWFDLDLIWNFVIWFKIIPNHHFLHNTMSLRVIDQRRRPCFVLTPLSFSNSTVILIYLELTIMNVCKTTVIFVRFDSYYVNWTFSKKNWHCGEIDFDLICDLPITGLEHIGHLITWAKVSSVRALGSLHGVLCYIAGQL